jgi:hypothetical protein
MFGGSVDRAIRAPSRFCHARAIAQIGLQPRKPRMRRQHTAWGCADQGLDVMPLGEQPGQQDAADIARGTGQK